MWSLTGYCEPSKPLVRASASGERASTSRPGVESPAYPSPAPRDPHQKRQRPDEREGRKDLFGSREGGYVEPYRTTPRLGFFGGFVEHELLLLGAMMPPASPRSLRILESASASGLLQRLCFPRVSSPMAKYASCSRAHGSQKGMLLIS